MMSSVAAGSFGKILVASDVLTGRLVAIKRQRLSCAEALREYRFFKAVRAAQSSARGDGSQHILGLLDDFTDVDVSPVVFSSSAGARPPAPVDCARGPGYLYLVFDYLDSSIEHEFRLRRGFVSVSYVQKWMRQVTLGLAFLHAAGVVHGDLSMANVLLDSRSSVRIADLGIAFCAGDALESRPVEKRGYCTAYVRAPEVILGTSQPSFPVDVWALGVLTLTLLSGSRLFHPDTEDAERGNELVLANQVAVLGPVTDWPVLEDLRHYGQFKQVLEGNIVHRTPAAFLSDASRVTRPVLASDLGCAFALHCLQYNPEKRPTSAQAAQHPYLQGIVHGQLSDVLQQSSHAVLHELVLRLAASELELDPQVIAAYCQEHARAPAVLHGPSQLANVPSGRSPSFAHTSELSTQGSVSPALPCGPRQHAVMEVVPWACPQASHAHSGKEASAECTGTGDSPATVAEQIQKATRATFGDIPPAPCECSGNCGRALCDQRKKLKIRKDSNVRVCDGVVKGPLGCQLCPLCKCELEECARPRNATRGRGRFCSAHGAQLTIDKRHYVNQFGQHVMGATWPLPLRLCARLSFVLERLEPEDVRAWKEFCCQRGFGTSCGAQVEPAEWIYMLVGCMCKWPETLRSGLVFDTGPVDPARVCDSVVKALRHASGRTMTVYHDHCTNARGHSHTGLVWFAKRIGLLEGSPAQEDGGPTKRRRRKTGAAVETLNLGKGGAPYVLQSDRQDAVQCLSRMLSACPKVRWPQQGSDVGVFLDGFVTAASEGLCVEEDSYCVQCFCRKVAWILPPQCLRDFTDSLTVERLGRYTPDVGDALRSLFPECVGRELRLRFGLDIFWLSCWLCGLGALTPDRQEALEKAEEMRLLFLAAGRNVSPVPSDELVAPSLRYLSESS